MDIGGLELSFDGSPFVQVCAPSINTGLMEISFDGSPFISSGAYAGSEGAPVTFIPIIMWF
jgi:hypothetical protein